MHRQTTTRRSNHVRRRWRHATMPPPSAAHAERVAAFGDKWRHVRLQRVLAVLTVACLAEQRYARLLMRFP